MPTVGMLFGLNGQDVWRMRVEPPGVPEHITSLCTEMTGSAVSETNDGHVLVTQSVRAGGLRLIQARPGTRF